MGTFGQSDVSIRRQSIPRPSRTVPNPKLPPLVWARWVKLPLGNWSHWDRPALSCQIWPLPMKSTRAGGARDHMNSASRYRARRSGWSAGGLLPPLSRRYPSPTLRRCPACCPGNPLIEGDFLKSMCSPNADRSSPRLYSLCIEALEVLFLSGEFSQQVRDFP